MKKVLALVALLVTAPALFAQSQPSNSVAVTVVAVPSAPVIGVTPSSFYQNTAASLTITVGNGGVSAACSGTWDSTALTLTFTAASGTTPAKFTAQVTAAMTATVGAHSVVISCPLPVLSMNSPVTLPNASVNQPYTADLASLTSLRENGQPCGTCSFSLASGSLPTGLSLSSSGVVHGTPSGAGSFNFSFTVSDATNAPAAPIVALNWTGDDPMIDDGTSTVVAYNVYRRNTTADPTFCSTPLSLS